MKRPYLVFLAVVFSACASRINPNGQRDEPPAGESRLTRLADEHFDTYRAEMAAICDELSEREFKDFDELYATAERRFNAAYEHHGHEVDDIQEEMKSRLKTLQDAKAVFQEMARGYRK